MAKTTKKSKTAKAQPGIEEIDPQILATARMLVEEERIEKSSRKKWGRGSSTGDELLDAVNDSQIKSRTVSRAAMKRALSRTFSDVHLSNTFVKDGKTLRHLTVKQATGMDGLRDIDSIPNSDVGVDPAVATSMNPEGRFKLPVSSTSSHDYSRRFNQVMNPMGSDIDWDIVPSAIVSHFSQFATFIGFPLIEMFALHPTVSNACSIPAEDAIAPGYTISFVDSEDLNQNGIPDDLEAMEYGAVKKSLTRISSIKALKEAIVSLSDGNVTNAPTKASEASLEALARVLERLAAYEEWERYNGGGENVAQAVHEGVTEPVSDVLTKFSQNRDENSIKEAITTLALALSDLSKKEHPVLDEVRVVRQRRETESAVSVAIEAVNRPEEEWNTPYTLTQLAVAFERLNAYNRLSAKNEEICAELSMALTCLSEKVTQESKDKARNALAIAKSAMDADEFAFQDPNAITKSNAGPSAAVAPNLTQGEELQPQIDPQAQMQAQMQAQQAAQEQQKQAEEEEQKEREQVAKIANERQKMLDNWKQRADDMGMNKVCEDIVRISRIYGIGIAVPLVEGANYEKPFDISQVKPDSYKGFVVIEPTFIYPETDSNDLINPLSGTFMEPTYWVVTGGNKLGNLAVSRIHRSWLVIHRHKEVPIMFRPMYYFGGLSLTQELYEPVFIADKLMNEAPKLAMTKRTTVIKGDPNDLVTNTDGVIQRLQALSQIQDNFGTLFIGRNAEVTRLDTSLSEFDQLIAKANQRIAATAEMPETKLFKTQLAGMNSAGRYEWDDYIQLLNNLRGNVLIPLLSLHYRLDSISKTGKVIQVKITFNSDSIQGEDEKGESESRNTQTINAALQAQWITPGEARILARSRKGSIFSSLPAELPKELMQSQQQQGGMPGMPGDMGGDMGGGEMPSMPQMSPEAGPSNEMPKEPKAPQAPKAQE